MNVVGCLGNILKYLDITPKRIIELIKSIPASCLPRLGGSCNLYFRGLTDKYRDIDIIINKDTLELIQWEYPKIENSEYKGINKRVKYCIDGREVDILESINPITNIEYNEQMGIYFESEFNVRNAKRLINQDKF